MKKIKFSVIVPIYNSCKYLKKCLNSLVNQTYNNLEIILVDDGSSDRGIDIINEYLSKYDNIIYRFKENGGQGSARNLGLTLVSGDYVSFVDSDDFVELNMFETLYNKICESNYDIIVYNMFEIINNNAYCNKLKVRDVDVNKNYIVSPAGPCNKVFSNRVAKNIKFLEKYIYEDLAIIPSIVCYSNNIVFIDDALYNYVIHEKSTMRQEHYSDKLLDIFTSLKHLTNEFCLNESYELYRDEIEYVYIENLLHGATLRFIKYEDGLDAIYQIIKLMKTEFPKFYKNKYFKSESLKYKLLCFLIYHKQLWLLKLLLKKGEYK